MIDMYGNIVALDHIAHTHSTTYHNTFFTHCAAHHGQWTVIKNANLKMFIVMQLGYITSKLQAHPLLQGKPFTGDCRIPLPRYIPQGASRADSHKQFDAVALTDRLAGAEGQDLEVVLDAGDIEGEVRLIGGCNVLCLADWEAGLP